MVIQGEVLARKGFGRVVLAMSLCLTVLVSSCSSTGEVDAFRCGDYGLTIWDRCWWINNAWVLGVGICGSIYVWIWRLLYRWDQEGKSIGGYAILHFFVGTPVFMFATLFVTMMFEELFSTT